MAVIVFEVIICSATLEAECVLFFLRGGKSAYNSAYGVCLPLSSLCAQSFKEAVGIESRVLL